jgi:large subunit ribosomal protein L20
MTRVTNAVASRRKKNRLFKNTKGYYGDRKNHLTSAKHTYMRALAFNYEHRKQNKRNFRSLWIIRISAAAKIEGISYSKLIHGLQLGNCIVDRKMLSDMAIRDPQGFTAIVTIAKQALEEHQKA